MEIKSVATGKVTKNVTEKDWAKLKELGNQSKFTIVSKEDSKEIPKEVAAKMSETKAKKDNAGAPAAEEKTGDEKSKI